MKSTVLVTKYDRGLARGFASLFVALRPADWIKNVFVGAPLFFSGQATDFQKVSLTVLVALAFCTMSSAAYLLNDICDQRQDRYHPTKCFRPIASGALGVRVAASAILVLAIVSLVLVSFSWKVVGVLGCYGLLNIAYSLWIKQIVVMDVISLGIGFVFRVYGGGFAIGVLPSSWLVLTTFLLSLFLALAKRRQELLLIGKEAAVHRPVLEQYSIKFIDELISVVTPVTLVTYILYTLDSVTVARFQSDYLFLTSLFVVFGIFRYLYLIHQNNLGGSPTDLVIRDIPLILAILGWILSFVLIVYFS